MKNSKITISDIAKSMNISVISVSRALSGQGGVSESLRNKIIRKSIEMGYTKSKENNLNILVLHQKQYIQDNSNFSLMVQGIENSLQNIKAEYNIEFVTRENQDKMKLPCKVLKGSFFNGVIFLGKFNYEYASFIKEKIHNQVFYLGYSPSYDCDYVYYNFNNSGFKICEYLIKKGHRSFGFIGGRDNYKNKEFMLGIAEAIEKNNLNPENIIINESDSLENYADLLLKSSCHPTAVICTLDFNAIKFMQILSNKGIKVPDDITVTGNGNTEMSSLSIPPLTTMELNIQYSCDAAVDLLIRRISNPEKPYEGIAIGSSLVERNSVLTL